ncbi:hypothetical protein M404DRAFT_396740 [Pisolithus tinctorius Marx 270]|uniref:Uncharacterized protein n=1 Tax=Pisolithus tinctorius Marx 270 TaxID=870435 RepID=A0A0C3P433_PISTI|nr:hypothetical protein M404DRAFT_396740 [Pisolithus tinctorius Marx 270]
MLPKPRRLESWEGAHHCWWTSRCESAEEAKTLEKHGRGVGVIPAPHSLGPVLTRCPTLHMHLSLRQVLDQPLPPSHEWTRGRKAAIHMRTYRPSCVIEWPGKQRLYRRQSPVTNLHKLALDQCNDETPPFEGFVRPNHTTGLLIHVWGHHETGLISERSADPATL